MRIVESLGAVPAGLLEMAEGVFGSAGNPLRVVPLPGDGSERRFYRMILGRRRAVGVWSPRRKEAGIDENDSYLLIGRHLEACDVPVPKFLGADASRGCFLVEDFGSLVIRRRKSLLPIYVKVIRTLLSLHERARAGFLPEYCFDAPLYDPSFVLERELEYFRKAFLEEFLGLCWTREGAMRAEFEKLAGMAGVVEPVHVIHRDFQSRNLMVVRGRIGVVDFQGMRFGPPAYDLASLLIDPYVNLPESVQSELKELYWQGARRFLGTSRRGFERSYGAVRLCRNLQVLAAYAFLGMVRGKTRFFAYIPDAWSRLRRSLRLAGPGTYPTLARRLGDEQMVRMIERRLQTVLRDKGL